MNRKSDEELEIIVRDLSLSHDFRFICAETLFLRSIAVATASDFFGLSEKEAEKDFEEELKEFYRELMESNYEASN